MKPTILALSIATLLLLGGCSASGPSSSDPPPEEADLAGKKTTKVDPGSFDLVDAPGGRLSSIFCEHYFSLELSNGTKGATARFDPRIRNCDGEEEPRSSDPDVYVLHEVSKDACGVRVLEGTVPWGGAVTRTLRVTDGRKACGRHDARVTAEDLRTLHGQTNSVATYYSVDPG